MTSIAFTSLFLGLVLGAQTLGVNVSGPVASVEYELDGRPIAVSVEPPWSVRADFGDELSPHILAARAIGRDESELARAQQWLNLPRPRAETEIVLEKDASRRAVAVRLSWQSLLGSRPVSVSVTFDGRPLSVDERRRVALPVYESGKTHLLTAEVEFREGIRSRTDVVFGADTGEEARTELTAIPVTVRKGGHPPKIDELQDCLEDAGRPLRIVAVEDGPAQVVIVRDRGNREIREVVGGGSRYIRPEASEHFFGDIRLAGNDRVRFVWPVARRYADPVLSSDLFDSSADFTMSSGSFHWILTRVYHPEGSLPQQRFSDAAAVAGLEAFASSRRRAVVVVLGSVIDSSRLSPENVRLYLERLRVPLFIWSLADPAARPEILRWGRVDEVGSTGKFRKAVRALRENLAAQRIVWIEGKHLPQEIRLTEKGASFLDLVGSER